MLVLIPRASSQFCQNYLINIRKVTAPAKCSESKGLLGDSNRLFSRDEHAKLVTLVPEFNALRSEEVDDVNHRSNAHCCQGAGLARGCFQPSDRRERHPRPISEFGLTDAQK